MNKIWVFFGGGRSACILNNLVSRMWSNIQWAFALCRRPPGLWILGVGVDFSFWSDLGKSSMIWFFEGYGWIRTKKLIWLLPFSGQMVRQLASSCPSSFPNLTFGAHFRVGQNSADVWFSKNLIFWWDPLQALDLGKSSQSEFLRPMAGSALKS